MSEPLSQRRVRFVQVLGAMVFVFIGIIVLMVYALGPVRFAPKNAAAPTTALVDRPKPTSPASARVVRKPTRVSPFTDLDSDNPRLRELALRSRPPVEAWLTDPDTTPEMRTEAAALIRKAFTDEDPDVRLAAAEFVTAVKNFPEVKAADAIPVWEAFLTDKDEERRVQAAVQLWERHAHEEAGKALVRVVKNRSADAKLRTRAAQAVTDDPPFARPDGMTEALDAILATPTENKSVRWCAFDQFKKARNRGEAMPATHRQTLLKLAEEADPELGYAAVKELTTDLSRLKVLPDDFRPTLLKLVEAKTTAPELRAAAFDALFAAKPDADTRKVAEKLLEDADAPTDMREKAFDVIVSGVKAGEVPDAIRSRVAALAADADTPVKTRIRAFDLLSPSSKTFAKDFPQLAATLDKAVGDGKVPNAFRAFAACRFKPDTAEKFATAIDQLTGSGDSAFVNLLADSVAAHFPDEQAFPKEWVTDKLAERMATRPFATATPPARLQTLFADALFAHGMGVVPALAGGLGEPSLRKRNVGLLERFGADAKPAAAAVLGLFASPHVSAEDKVLLGRVIAAFGPDEIVTRLKAKGGTVEERALLLKQLKQDAKERLALFTELLGHEQREVRVWAAEEIGKIGPDANAAIPKLVEQLKADVAATKKASTQPAHGPFVEALAAIGPDCLPAVSELTTDAEPMVRVAAAEVFGYLGAEVRSKATPLLRKLIADDKDETVKQAALHALGQVNPKEAEKLGWVPPQAKRVEPEQGFGYVERPTPVYRDPLPTYTPPRPTTPTYKPYTPPYRPVYLPLYRPLYIPRR